MATRASELALADARLLNDALLIKRQAGIAYGSSAGTPKAICGLRKMVDEKKHQEYQRDDLHQNDESHRAGQSRVFWASPANYYDHQRLHFRQSRHWLRL